MRSRAFGLVVLLASGACTSFDSPATNADASADASADAAAPTTPSDAYAAAVIEDRPLAYWRLRETNEAFLADLVGDNRLLVRNGPALGAGGLFGGSGGAVGFDGVKGRRLVASTLPPVVAAGRGFAFEAWMYLANPGDATTRYVVLQSDGTRELAVFIDNDITVDITDSGKRGFVNHAAPSTNAWHHVVVQGQSALDPVLWLDGAPSARSGTRDANADAVTALTIGARDDNDPSIGPGAKVAEVAVYDHPLEDRRILRHFELGQQK